MITYAQAGVNIDAGNELVNRIKKIVSASKRGKSSIGGFSGLYPLPKGFGKGYISGCCDGVGTKLKLAFLLNKHDTVGIDLVAMNVNDLICQGATPLFFLDYFGCGKLDVDTAESVIRGIYNGCEESGCVLLGGETAEMPGFYEAGEYDLAGFAVGILKDANLVNRKGVKAGDAVIGLASSGVHSNGFSLVRKIFSEEELKENGDALIAPTRIYVKKIMALLNNKKFKGAVKAIAHITGGGWPENPPRVVPKGFQFEFKKGSWPILDIYKKMQRRGNVEEAEMFRTFNMGIGLMLVVAADKADAVRAFLKEGYFIGHIAKGNAGVVFK